MLYYFKKGNNAPEMQKKICAVYGEDAVTDRMCQKWFVGDFPGGPVVRTLHFHCQGPGFNPWSGN